MHGFVRNAIMHYIIQKQNLQSIIQVFQSESLWLVKDGFAKVRKGLFFLSHKYRTIQVSIYYLHRKIYSKSDKTIWHLFSAKYCLPTVIFDEMWMMSLTIFLHKYYITYSSVQWMYYILMTDPEIMFRNFLKGKDSYSKNVI